VANSVTEPAIHDLIRARWSPRSFSSRPVTDQELRLLFEAARWAASSYNEQPWRFLVARKGDGAAYNKMLSLLAPANQAWAGQAPVLFITAAKRTFSHSGAPNLHALHDAGQALANLLTQATALGLHAHPMAGFDRERARKELQIPDDYELGAAVAVGYFAPVGETKPRTRKPLSEIVFGSGWNQPPSFDLSGS
jgi:nitroreductase